MGKVNSRAQNRPQNWCVVFLGCSRLLAETLSPVAFQELILYERTWPADSLLLPSTGGTVFHVFDQHVEEADANGPSHPSD